ncbi:DNA cytosine methyltransferase [Maritimibacter sp. UBA3975]|uniref:DNA cytosine methyltransferase n=1 Tax=Maritimibacter sp. UBA3975 TaxID=1946833 RepID=UPI0025BF0146|nr:DNA cytosine methyltransferase [Maritimibacter sp. UBA3975]|tara:strand:+ start:10663 stop:12537 length:1875 start_codon:yes stop_codon:yes gene_type:complete
MVYQNMRDVALSRRIKTLSLFSGAGGMDIGFHNAGGYDIVGCVEISAKYAATLEANTGAERFFGDGTQVFCQDVEDFDAEAFSDKGVECIIGGPPCQTFSAAGRRAGGVIGTSDVRGQLFKRYCEIVEIVRPKVFVFENVYGLPGANGGAPWRSILESFSALGYRLNFEVVDAADYGVPQHRERLFLIGALEKQFDFPKPTHGPDSDSDQPLTSVAAAIEDLQNPAEHPSSGPGGMYGHLLPLVPPGLNYSFFTAEMGHPKPVFAWRSKFHDLLYKVDPSYPCRTLKAQPGKFTGPFHWKNRHFSVPELKRLQTFPDEYHLEGNQGVVLEQIGNSVPPRLAQVIAMAISNQYFGGQFEDVVPRPQLFKSTFRTRQRERSKLFKEIARKAIEDQLAEGMIDEELQLFDEEYFLPLGEFFSVSKMAEPTAKGRSAQVSVKDRGEKIEVNFSSAPSDSRSKGKIKICGLEKYLHRIKEIEIICQLAETRDVFFLWWAIQDVMVSRSRFFTLIDIYGHYANRGDTVKVTGSYGLNSAMPKVRALNYFLNSANCGGFWDRSALSPILEVSQAKLDRLVEDLRAIRMDIRTSTSHPIIGPDRVLCTYPFPLLSQKALVVSRVEFLEQATS